VCQKIEQLSIMNARVFSEPQIDRVEIIIETKIQLEANKL
jgi:hypothetical protein